MLLLTLFEADGMEEGEDVAGGEGVFVTFEDGVIVGGKVRLKEGVGVEGGVPACEDEGVGGTEGERVTEEEAEEVEVRVMRCVGLEEGVIDGEGEGVGQVVL